MPEGFCDQCKGSCCTDFTVYLTHADIKRLLEGVNRDPKEFITPYSTDGTDIYPLIKTQEFGEFEIRLGLSRMEELCFFMKTINGQKRCMIQSHKPMVCRTYPFSITEDGKLTHADPYICPGPVWPATDAEVEAALKEVRQLIKELEDYEVLVKKWNSLPEEERTDVLTFLKFLSENAPQ